MIEIIISFVISFAVGYYFGKRSKPSYYGKYVEAEFDKRTCERQLKTCKDDVDNLAGAICLKSDALNIPRIQVYGDKKFGNYK